MSSTYTREVRCGRDSSAIRPCVQSAAIPRIRTEASLHSELESALRPAETLSDFVEAHAPTAAAPQAGMHKLVTGMMKRLTRRSGVVEEEGSTWMAESDGDSDEAGTHRPLQALEQPCRCITRRALADGRAQTNAARQVVLMLKTPRCANHVVLATHNRPRRHQKMR